MRLDVDDRDACQNKTRYCFIYTSEAAPRVMDDDPALVDDCAKC